MASEFSPPAADQAVFGAVDTHLLGLEADDNARRCCGLLPGNSDDLKKWLPRCAYHVIKHTVPHHMPPWVLYV